MAITYTQPINIVQVGTLMDNFVVAQGAEATAALIAYRQKKTMSLIASIGGTDTNVLVPYHAVQAFVSGVMTEEATKEDAYCE